MAASQGDSTRPKKFAMDNTVGDKRNKQRTSVFNDRWAVNQMYGFSGSHPVGTDPANRILATSNSGFAVGLL